MFDRYRMHRWRGLVWGLPIRGGATAVFGCGAGRSGGSRGGHGLPISWSTLLRWKWRRDS